MAQYQKKSRQKYRKKSHYSAQKGSNMKKRVYRRKPNMTRQRRRARRSPQSTSTSSSSVDDCSENTCSLCEREQNQGCDRGNKHDEGSGSESQSGSFRESVPASRKQSPEASPIRPSSEHYELNMPQPCHEILDVQGFEVAGMPPLDRPRPERKPEGSCQPCQQSSYSEPFREPF